MADTAGKVATRLIPSEKLQLSTDSFSSQSSSEEWDEKEAPKQKQPTSSYICVCKVIRDFVPTTHTHLTLHQGLPY